MKNLVARVNSSIPVKFLEQNLDTCVGQYIDEVIAVTQIPAPSLDEGERAAYVARRFKDVGLVDVVIDEVNNVIARLPGKSSTATLSVSAHLDTVFPRGTDLNVTRDGSILRGPGVGDNSSAVAALISLADILVRSGYEADSDLIFLANAGEEGLGNLLGVREFFRSYVERPDVSLEQMLIFDGGLGMLCNQGVASRRVKVTVKTQGGHSWKDFGRDSAIALLSSAVHEIYGIKPPKNPRTTYNVGTITGGTSVNTVAQSAEALIDMRSVCPEALEQLVSQVDEALERGLSRGEVIREVLGERPGGRLDPDHKMIRVLHALSNEFGLDLKMGAGSTDANWPLSVGVPAVTIGLTKSDGTHTLEEWVDTSYAGQSLRWALTALIGLCG